MRRRPADSVIVAILAGFGMLGPFSTDTIFPAFAELGGDLAASPVALQQLVSVYLVVYAAFSLFHGPLSDARGRRPVIITGLLVYLAASAGCALAPNFAFLLVMRGLQGAGAGAAQIIGRALVRDYFEGARAQKMMAQVSMIFAVAPAAAPMVGGWILGWSNWRAIFWFLVAWAAVMIAATLVLPEPVPPGRRHAFSARRVLDGLGTVWRKPAGRRLALNGALHFGAVWVFISSAPLMMGRLGAGEQDYWMLFVPIVIGMIGGSWTSGRLAHLPGRRLAHAGYAVGVVGLVLHLAMALLPATQSLPFAVLALPILSFGMSLTFPILNLAMLDLYPANRGAAASVQGFVGLLMNALIAGVLAPVLNGVLVAMGAASLVLFGAAWLVWTAHARAVASAPTTPDAAGYEPMDEL